MSEVEAEAQILARQVAKTLGVSSGMLRRYALAFEAITETTIKQHPRDGRQYTQEQLEALVRAKGYVNHNPDMSVDAAIKLALGANRQDTVQPPISLQEVGAELSTEAVQKAFSVALTPLLTELQALRSSNERMTNEVVELRRDLNSVAVSELQGPRDLPPVTETTPTDDGVLVRGARWLESLLRR